MTAQHKMYRVVVGVDGSPSSRQALRWDVRKAYLTGGTVDAVIAWHCQPVPGPWPAADIDVPPAAAGGTAAGPAD